jgi:GNAT superfamily N-acetyltransferase
VTTAVHSPSVRIVQLQHASYDALDLLAEYYEAVHVAIRDPPGALETIIQDSASGVWLAFLDHEPVGCVLLRRLSSVPSAAECKRLYVRPSARDRGVAGRLLDALEEHARTEGLQWIYLDSYDDLTTAIALYERRGYLRCARYNDNPQATIFMRKRLA